MWSWMNTIRGFFAPPNAKLYRVSWDELELRLRSDDGDGWSQPWGDIDRIVTFKEDQLVTDHVYLEFHSRADDLCYLVEESDPGFDDLREELCRRYEGFPEDWYFQTTREPFAYSYRVLYEKSAPAAGASGDPAQRIR
ncbi:MAG: hypothetical protein R3F20_02105 [Planctomycetota bacterium]